MITYKFYRFIILRIKSKKLNYIVHFFSPSVGIFFNKAGNLELVTGLFAFYTVLCWTEGKSKQRAWNFEVWTNGRHKENQTYKWSWVWNPQGHCLFRPNCFRPKYCGFFFSNILKIWSSFSFLFWVSKKLILLFVKKKWFKI